ncbi:cytochrome c oxidase assembly protein [Paenibacillus pabuli]|uniref:cytochrome c oxidase assembly protein n=1 Tax=Paenibacillus pabuli TaxID=1472 RepID=UPI0032425D6B
MYINSHLHHYQGTEQQHLAWIVVPQLLLALPFVIALGVYIIAAIRSNPDKPWPLNRIVYWCIGVTSAVLAITGPLASLAHTNFAAHMLSHLLLGMFAPLLMVMAAPMTLLLKTLSTPLARRLTRMLKSWPSRLLTHPIFTTCLNIGGLWLLYTTNLYSLMHEHIVLYLLIHVHIFIAGYLYTLSFLYIDPVFHRFSFVYRSIVLIISLAGHGILSKIIYVQPPSGVSLDQAKVGGMLMYYGGDMIDLVLIIILCSHWFRSTRPRMVWHPN